MNINEAMGTAARRLLITSSVTLCFAGQAPAIGWKGITPLHSTQNQVRLKLGKPSYETTDRMEFNKSDGKIVVFFYTQADTRNLSLVPSLAGKVLTIYFYPSKPRVYDLDDLKKKTRTVGRGVTSEGDAMTSYDDGERGISYHFRKNETKVWRVVYYAPRVEFARFKLEGGAR